MTHTLPPPARLELEFFGTAMAVVSHDIKNVLAIIGESAGLLDDLVAMGRSTGRPPDLERVSKIAERIQNNTSRADSIVKRMNTFAHSTDRGGSSLTVAEAVALVIRMGERRWSRFSVTPSLVEPTAELTLQHSSFDLLRAVWTCLDAACQSAGPERRIDVQIEERDGSPTLRFIGLADTGPGQPPADAARAPDAPLSELPAGMELTFSARELTLRMPAIGERMPTVDANERRS